MAKPFQAARVARGDVIDYIAVAALLAGAVIVNNGIPGVTALDIAQDAQGSLNIDDGVYEVVKANEVQAIWAALYWDADGNPYNGTAGTGCLTTTSGGNTFFGWAIKAAGATDESVFVFKYLASTVSNTVHNNISAVIADPGNAGAITITDSGYVPIVTAGAETRTLAAPTYVGQEILINMKTDGGDCVITCATTIASTGTNTITLNDAGDSIRLQAIENGANKRWRVVVNDGCTLSTV